MYVSDSITNYLMPQNNKINVTIESSMIGSALDMYNGDSADVDEEYTTKIIMSLISLAFESGVKIQKEYELLILTLLNSNEPSLESYYQHHKYEVASLIKEQLMNTDGKNETEVDELTQDIKFEEEYKIRSIIHNPHGKWPLFYGNIIMIDYEAFETVIRRQLIRTIGRLEKFFDISAVREKIFSSVNEIRNFGLQANILFKDRRDIFYNQDLEKMKVLLENIAIGLGQNYTIASPALENLEGLETLTQMQNSSFLCVILLLSFVSGIVVYSLMLFDIDERRYEMGMLRALGMSKDSIIILMLNQSFFFSIPGMIIGIIFAYLLYLASYAAIFAVSHTPIPYLVKTSSVLYGV